MAHQYECILLGATGYTGKWTAEYITTHLPTDFKWAIAGRSEAKLKNLVDELRSLNQDRQAPGIEVVQLQHNELLQLVKKTKVLITTVGPYHKYGEVALQACAETGTHYLDVTGEVPWVLEMTQKYHETAKRTGAIIIPQNGVESAPADLMCWKLASLIRERFSQGTGELVFTIHDMSVAASGGTLATALGLFDTYSFQQLAKSQDPYCLSLDASSQKGKKRPIMETLAGVRTVSGLGTLTDSIQGPADIPIIHRSRSLYGDKLYGENFYVTAYMRARNAVTAFGFHILFMAAMLAITLSPVRWLMKQFVYAPGDGPSKECVFTQLVTSYLLSQF